VARVVTLRLYRDDDRRADLESGSDHAEVELFGWGHEVGRVFAAGSATYRLVDVYTAIQTDDPQRGDYVYADAVEA